MTVITRLNGGLGNQLFQVAMGLAVANASDGRLFLDRQGLLNTAKRGKATPRKLEVSNLGWSLWPEGVKDESSPLWLPIAQGEGSSAPMTAMASVLSSLMRGSRSRCAYISERSLKQDLPSLISDLATKEFIYLSGYWANSAVPELVRAEMRQALLSVPLASARIAELGEQLRSSTGIAVHVRRGDFFTDVAPQHGVLTNEYFFQAIETLYEQGDTLFFFSDDPEWCRATFHEFNFATFVEPDPADLAIEHMVLMSKAQKFVLSNSSFSWWSAWLSEVHGSNIVRPHVWVGGNLEQAETVYPSGWKTLGKDR